ncbi:MAG: chorismate-binding protein, partial [Tepidiformaceae bacterium]
MTQTELSPASESGPSIPFDASPQTRGKAIAAVVASLERMRPAGRAVFAAVQLPALLVDELLGGGLVRLREAATASWERHDAGQSLFALGVSVRLSGGATSTLGEAAAALREAGNELRYAGPAAARPRFFGGARFAPGGSVRDSAWRAFGGWQFVLPEILVAMEDGLASATLTLQLSAVDSECEIGAKVHQALTAPFKVRPVGQPAAADARPGPALSPDAWQSAVTAAISEIRAAQYRKVVLARRAVEQRDRGATSIGDVLTRLGTRYPACFVFKFATEGSDWIGASPELLGSVDGEVVR